MTDPICQKNFTQKRLFQKKRETPKYESKENSYLFQHKKKSNIKFGREEYKLFEKKIKVPQKKSLENELFQTKERIQGPTSSYQDLFQHKIRVKQPETKYLKQWEEKRKVKEVPLKQPYIRHKSYHEIPKTKEIIWQKPRADGQCNKTQLEQFSLFNNNIEYIEQQNLEKSNSSAMAQILRQDPFQQKVYARVQQQDSIKNLLNYEFIQPYRKREISLKCTQISLDYSHYRYNDYNENDYRKKCLISERFQ